MLTVGASRAHHSAVAVAVDIERVTGSLIAARNRMLIAGYWSSSIAMLFNAGGGARVGAGGVDT